MDLLDDDLKFIFKLKNNKAIQNVKTIRGQTKNTHLTF